MHADEVEVGADLVRRLVAVLVRGAKHAIAEVLSETPF
jgi:hypothetical protein